MSNERANLLVKLDAKIPRDAISTRDGGQGRKLDYLSGYYVIARMNELLGQGNWDYNSSVVKLHEGLVKGRYGEVFSVHYMAQVTLRVTMPDGVGGTVYSNFTDYGYGDGTDKVSPGKAHELAIKEAVTDGVKRCAKNLGMSLGLALYSKEQENVDEVGSPQERVVQDNPTDRAPDTKPSGVSEPAGDAGKVIGLVKQTAKVIIAKGLATKDSIKEELKTKYGVDKSDELDLNQATEFLKEMETKLNERTN